MTFCPLFELQKVTLGEMVFEGAKQLQMQKFHLGWKVDRPSFPMSHLAPDVDQCNPLKSCSKGRGSESTEGAAVRASFARIDLFCQKTLF